MNKSADGNIEMNMDKAENLDQESSQENVGDATNETDESHASEGDSNEKSEEVEVIEEKTESESERYLRLAAEFDNYKKRTAREFGDLIGRANMELLKSLVEIADNFERALAAETDGNNLAAYRKGVELTYEQLTNLLARENVSPIDAVGELFDPNCHEAMMQEESDDFEEGIVSKEIQKGYRLNDRILRHSRVVVSLGSKEGRQDDKKDNE